MLDSCASAAGWGTGKMYFAGSNVGRRMIERYACANANGINLVDTDASFGLEQNWSLTQTRRESLLLTQRAKIVVLLYQLFQATGQTLQDLTFK